MERLNVSIFFVKIMIFRYMSKYKYRKINDKVEIIKGSNN